MTTQKRDREKTIKHLKKIALNVFSTKGFDKGTTKEIANKAEISEALITRYFGSKEGLLESLIIEFIEESFGKKLPYEEQGDLSKEIMLFTLYMFKEIFNQKKIYKTMTTKLLTDPKVTEKVFEAFKAPGFEASGEFHLRLKKLQERKEMTEVVSTAFVHEEILYHIISHLLFTHTMKSESIEQIEENSKRWAIIFAKGLRY